MPPLALMCGLGAPGQGLSWQGGPGPDSKAKAKAKDVPRQLARSGLRAQACALWPLTANLSGAQVLLTILVGKHARKDQLDARQRVVAR